MSSQFTLCGLKPRLMGPALTLDLRWANQSDFLSLLDLRSDLKASIFPCPDNVSAQGTPWLCFLPWLQEKWRQPIWRKKNEKLREINEKWRQRWLWWVLLLVPVVPGSQMQSWLWIPWEPRHLKNESPFFHYVNWEPVTANLKNPNEYVSSLWYCLYGGSFKFRDISFKVTYML